MKDVWVALIVYVITVTSFHKKWNLNNNITNSSIVEDPNLIFQTEIVI